MLLSVAGLGIAIYMVVIHYQVHALVCGIGNCEKVQTSRYAELHGIPIAWFGLAMSVAILFLLVLNVVTPAFEDLVAVAMFGLTFAGTLAVAYLTYLEIWVIEAICQWCVIFAIITVSLFSCSLEHLRHLFVESDASRSNP